MSEKVDNCYTLSHEQCFSKHRFLDICCCVFKGAVAACVESVTVMKKLFKVIEILDFNVL